MSELISHAVKRTLYKSGSYIVGIPKGPTSEWSVNDWIDYIDANGTWVV